MSKDFSSLHGRKITVTVEKWFSSANHDKTPPDEVVHGTEWRTPEDELITDPEALIELERRLAAKELETHDGNRRN